MTRELYVFMDSVSGNFGEPFTMANAAELRRHFEQLARNPEIPDYAIRDTVVLHLGTFDANPDHPVLIPKNIPTVVLRGDTYHVEEIRRPISEIPAAASELLAGEDC